HPLRKHAFESVWSAVCAVTGASRAVSHFRLVGADDRRQVYYLTKYISKEASLVRMSKNFGSGPVPTKSAAVSADRLAASRSEVSTDESCETVRSDSIALRVLDHPPTGGRSPIDGGVGGGRDGRSGAEPVGSPAGGTGLAVAKIAGQGSVASETLVSGWPVD